MRVLIRDSNEVLTIIRAKRKDKHLVLTYKNMLDDVVNCCTNDYYSENTALGVLTNLVVDGYIIVDTLHYEG